MGGSFPLGSRMMISVVLLVASFSVGCLGEGASPSSMDPAADPQARASPSPPSLDVDVAHDFTQDSETVTFEVEPNATVSLRHVYFAPGTTSAPEPVPADLCSSGTEDARIVLTAPSGLVVYNVSIDAESVRVGLGSSCGEEIYRSTTPGVPIEAGTWTIEFTGTAFATGRVVLQG